MSHDHADGPAPTAIHPVRDDHLIYQFAKAHIDLNVLRTTRIINCMAEGIGVAIETIRYSMDFMSGCYRIAQGGHSNVVVEQLDLPEVDNATFF